MGKYATDSRTDDNIQFACRITKARIQKHSYNIKYIFFPTATMVMETRFNITLYVHCVYRSCCLSYLTLRLLMLYIYIYIYIHIYIYIYDISSLRVNDLTLILLTWRKW